MKILITGGLGLIGHNVIKSLQKLKHDVQAVDALTTYGSIAKEELEYLYKERLKELDKSTQIYKEDICGPELNQIFTQFKPDVVVHLASFPREAAVKANPIEAARTMCVGTANVLECCKSHETKRVIYVSSSMVYGDFDHAFEEDNLNPSGKYSIYKIAGEELVKEYHERTGNSYAIVRPTAVYGPRDVQERVVGKFFSMAFKDETLYVDGKDETLDFTYAQDTGLGIAQLALVQKNGTYNISRGQRVKIHDVAKKIIKLVGKGKIKLRDKQKGMPSRGTLDCTKARDDFNFNPKTSIDKGLKLYYNWLKSAKFYKEK
tara:strand:+ start:4184 stop:5137 length:954 start_codon:yes stop_codon:yes gene_type:complete